MQRTYHEVANLFPLLAGDEYEALKRDIAENGLREAIWLHPDGSIIDGRNRYRACQELGVEPQCQTWPGEGSLVAFVVSLNLHRRHLNSSQRAVIALDMLPMLEAEAKERMVAGAVATNTGSQRIDYPESSIGKATEQAAALLGTNRQYVADLKQLAKEDPEAVEQVRSGEATVPEVKRKARRRKQEQQREQAIEKAATAPDATDRYRVFAADCLAAIAQIAPGSIDAIITDPPYPREYLPAYADLACAAMQALRPGGSLFVMSGQSWLPEVFAALTSQPTLTYNWTLAYLTPGGQAVQVFPRGVNTFWKPVLWFVKGDGPSGKWVGDVCRSDTNDNDKRYHGWGQSISGMVDLVQRVSEPGALIWDPFCGGGATGVAALTLGRRFIGSDIDEDQVRITLGRLAGIMEADNAGIQS